MHCVITYFKPPFPHTMCDALYVPIGDVEAHLISQLLGILHVRHMGPGLFLQL